MRPKGRTLRRQLRHNRLRKGVRGSATAPRLAVYRSLNNIYAQLIDDDSGKTLASANTLMEGVKGSVKHGGSVAAAKKVGEMIAKKAATIGITRACFDRGGFRYHGATAAVAEAARAGGLKF